MKSNIIMNIVYLSMQWFVRVEIHSLRGMFYETYMMVFSLRGRPSVLWGPDLQRAGFWRARGLPVANQAPHKTEGLPRRHDGLIHNICKNIFLPELSHTCHFLNHAEELPHGLFFIYTE